MTRVLVSLCVVMLLVSVAFPAPSTSKPAAKPDPNTTLVTLEEAGISFRVPKTWKQSKKNATGVTFQLPGGGLIVLAGPANKGAELKAAVDEKKAKILEKSPSTKFSKDQATTLGGQEAWELMYDVQSTAHEVDTKTGKEVPGGKTMTMTQRWLDVTCIKDGVFVQMDFICAEKEFEARSKLARTMMATFEWTAPAPATKPAEEKK
jgi:hypothetical protein